MLGDRGRLRDGDDQIDARLSPRGDAVAYWVYPYEDSARLSIQFLDPTLLRAKGVSLIDELEKNREQRLQELRELQ
jgi:hypothetical protein